MLRTIPTRLFRIQSHSIPTTKMSTTHPSLLQPRPYSSHPTGNPPKITSTKPLEDKESRWVGLKLIDWIDEEGKERKWEAAGRKTGTKGVADAVVILPLLHPPPSPTATPPPPVYTIIILQYRPPISSICIELPAGLIDKGETASEAGVRELKEETGFGNGGLKDSVGSEERNGMEGVGVGVGEMGEKVRVLEVHAPVAGDPGMSSATMQLVTLNVEIKEPLTEDNEPKALLDEGEHIEKRVVEISNLYSTLQEYEKMGYMVDSRLSSFAWGIELSKKYPSITTTR